LKDEIFLGNLRGLLKQGRWSLNLTEATALVQIFQEVDRRLDPQMKVVDTEPIKQNKKKTKTRKQR
jgi:hypothetical protein